MLGWRSSTSRNNSFCLVAQSEFPFHRRDELQLKYDVCVGENIRAVHEMSIRDGYIPKPAALPDETMLLRPLWSTWAQYQSNVNQTIVLEMARRIHAEGFQLNSHVEIDNNWESCYGEATFDYTKFPNPQGSYF